VPPLERLLRRDRTITAISLLALCALAWLYLASGAGLDMGAMAADDPMSAMPGMAMENVAWSPTHWLLMAGMWWVMMIAMMTPSATPAILLYARVHNHAVARGDQLPAHAPTGVFAAGYFLIWLAFSVLAVIAQQALERSDILSATTMGSQVRWISGATLLLTGIYQLSPLKNVCLAHCRAPAVFISRHWRPHAVGALRLGALHGAYCVGCCWMLMALLFVGGVMNLIWIAVISLLILAEKVLALGRWVGRAAGLVLIVWGLALLLR
jgi:predicted metal-binding membrane protein